MGEDSSEGEILSWQNSLRYMADVVDCKEMDIDLNFYRRQVKLIRSLVGDDENAPLINTVECLQGQDVEYIFITFSASDPAYVREQLEFLLNPNRLNVMISRAKRKAVLVMSKELMKYFFGRYHLTLPVISE